MRSRETAIAFFAEVNRIDDDEYVRVRDALFAKYGYRDFEDVVTHLSQLLTEPIERLTFH